MSESHIQAQDCELYHVFIPYDKAKFGGSTTITLRSGKSMNINIPANSAEGDQLNFTRTNLNKNHNLFSIVINQINNQFFSQSSNHQNNVRVVLHTLFDKEIDIEKVILNLIENADIKLDSKKRCRIVYEQIKNGTHLIDLPALKLLDFIVASSQSNSSFIKRYNIASQNSKIQIIDKCIEDSLSLLDIKENQLLIIKGTYQYIKAGEYNTNFNVINQLDYIINNSSIPNEIKQIYFYFSYLSKATTTEIFITDLIENFPAHKNGFNKTELFSIYKQIRDGKPVYEQEKILMLESLILASSIPEECKIIYQLMRNPINNSKQNYKESNYLIDVVKKAKDSVEKASSIIPTATKLASASGITAGTGIAISSLSGGAATNATLAFLGGGSVAAGGLGMLGGLAVATGGSALIGAAALISIASVTQMNVENKQKLGMAAGVGVATSAAAVSTAWAAASAFGVASTGTAISTLSGAAAYSATIASLGGVGAITGGAALVTLGAGFAAWKFFQGDKNNYKRILKQLEANLYS
ncbi:hypothetical protein [Anabaena azotica]|uniref:Uncharacterized protein n=1 Tax=Anabaena azotica FACHB-119 TaxID=947527 RepID=A0ABR8DF18_9NOST|nr:hypothetical protein [Anabaena azotica]MBD2505241.1 hypothetical protein [Anabaena azotica FACHB-119]